MDGKTCCVQPQLIFKVVTSSTVIGGFFKFTKCNSNILFYTSDVIVFCTNVQKKMK